MKQKILDCICDLTSDFLYYDRKEDEDLAVGDIENAVREGEICIDDMVNKFREKLEEHIKTG